MDDEARVTYLDPGDSGLTGQNPTKLENPANLVWLDLVANGISGRVPPTLESLTPSGAAPSWLYYGSAATLALVPCPCD